MTVSAVSAVEEAPVRAPAERETPLSEDEDARLFFQRRLTLVTAVLAGFATFNSITNVFVRKADSVVRVGVSNQLLWLSGALALAFWAVFLAWPIGRRTIRELVWLDVLPCLLTTYGAGGLFALLRVRHAQHDPQVNELAILLILFSTYILVACAVVVPSTGRRTLWLSVDAILPAFLLGARMRVDALGPSPAFSDVTAQTFFIGRAALFTLGLAFLASKVIYGLRRQVRAKSRIGQYVLREKIGQGGMGVIYRATHATLRRETALKLLMP